MTACKRQTAEPPAAVATGAPQPSLTNAAKTSSAARLSAMPVHNPGLLADPTATNSAQPPVQPDATDTGVRDLRPKVDYSVLARDYRSAAERGDARAQAELGKLYWAGAGVERNAEAAVQWLRKAAEQGDADAQFYLGHAYALGYGVPKDAAEAQRWKAKATEQGYEPRLPSAGSRARQTQP